MDGVALGRLVWLPQAVATRQAASARPTILTLSTDSYDEYRGADMAVPAGDPTGQRVRSAVTRLLDAVDPFLPRSALLLATLTLGEALMGLLRDRVLARSFGAGPALDAYNSAVILPELLLDIVVAGGVQAALVPLFTRLRRDDERAAQVFGRTVIWAGVTAMVVVAVGLFVGAPWLAALAVPGFDAAGRDQYVTVLRLVAVTPALFAASIAVGELLVAHRRFVGYGLAPVLYNGGIAGCTFLLADRLGVVAPALGAAVGAALHLAIRLWDLRATGLAVRPAFAVRSRAFREFLVLMLPKMVGEPIDPLTRLVATAIASTLASGSVTAVIFAWNFESGAVSIVGLAFSVVAFPALAAAAADGDRRRFHGHRRPCRTGHRDPLERGRDPDGAPRATDHRHLPGWRGLRRGGRRPDVRRPHRLRLRHPPGEPDPAAGPGRVRHAQHAAAGRRGRPPVSGCWR